MSLELHVLFSRPLLPTVQLWQESIRANGFQMELHSALDPAGHSGFVPCVLQGKNTGFEYYLEDANDIKEAYPELSQDTGRYDCVASCRWGADFDECAVAIMAATALTTVVHGLMYDPQGNARFESADALSYARTALDQITKFQGR